ncbi:hypothetical protein BH23CHL5_BH23CHL5_04010 [soil metagenome]
MVDLVLRNDQDLGQATSRIVRAGLAATADGGVLLPRRHANAMGPANETT